MSFETSLEETPEEKVRRIWWSGVFKHGKKILPALKEYIQDPKEPLLVRSSVPLMVGHIGHKDGFEILEMALNHDIEKIRHSAVSGYSEMFNKGHKRKALKGLFKALEDKDERVRDYAAIELKKREPELGRIGRFRVKKTLKKHGYEPRK